MADPNDPDQWRNQPYPRQTRLLPTTHYWSQAQNTHPSSTGHFSRPAPWQFSTPTYPDSGTMDMRTRSVGLGAAGDSHPSSLPPSHFPAPPGQNEGVPSFDGPQSALVPPPFPELHELYDLQGYNLTTPPSQRFDHQSSTPTLATHGSLAGQGDYRDRVTSSSIFKPSTSLSPGLPSGLRELRPAAPTTAGPSQPQPFSVESPPYLGRLGHPRKLWGHSRNRVSCKACIRNHKGNSCSWKEDRQTGSGICDACTLTGADCQPR